MKNINTSTYGSNLASLTRQAGTVLFNANDMVLSNADAELWRSDGSAAGTFRVKDIFPGMFPSDPRHITWMNGEAYFAANPYPNGGPTLFKTDGSEAGTVQIGGSSLSVSGLKALDSRLVLVSSGTIWGSDGTLTGTAQLQAVGASDLMLAGPYVYFKGSSATTGAELWRSDGTAAGTVLVKDLEPGTNGSSPKPLGQINGKLLFRNGLSLWASDGSDAGTLPLSVPIDYQSMSAPPVQMGGWAYFAAGATYSNQRLWRTDGTPGGTGEVDSTPEHSIHGLIENMAVAGSLVYFRANSASGSELWKSDGSAAGTVQVKDIHAGPGWSSPTALVAVGSTLYFSADDGVNGAELWKTDGSEAGTVMVADIFAGPTGSSPRQGLDLGDGRILFEADNGPDGRELWVSDGTAGGTQLVKDIGKLPRESEPQASGIAGPYLYFAANDTVHGRELWRSDGSESGTIRLTDLAPGAADGYSYGGAALGGDFIFDGSGELWKSNGSPAGTAIVKSAAAGGPNLPDRFTPYAGQLFFIGQTAAAGYELWKTDGSAAGTALVKDAWPGAGHGLQSSSLCPMGGLLYFSAYDGATAQIWRSDGTVAGTYAATTLTGASVSSLIAGTSLLYFVRDADGLGKEPWVSDGTAAGTLRLADVMPGPGEPLASQFFTVGDRLFFVASDGAQGRELWTSDGTPAGTQMVADLSPGSSSSYFSNLVYFRGYAYFGALTSSGSGLWRSDGTSAGTVQVSTLPFDASWLIAANDRLYFRCNNILWSHDGTAEGTAPVPGQTGMLAVPPFTQLGQQLLFSAGLYTDGRELWGVDLAPVGTYTFTPTPTLTHTLTPSPSITVTATPTRTPTATPSSTPANCQTFSQSAAGNVGSGSWTDAAAVVQAYTADPFLGHNLGSTDGSATNLVDGVGGVVDINDPFGSGPLAGAIIQVVYRANNTVMRLDLDYSINGSAVAGISPGGVRVLTPPNTAYNTVEIDLAEAAPWSYAQAGALRVFLQARSTGGGGSRSIDVDSVRLLYDPCVVPTATVSPSFTASPSSTVSPTFSHSPTQTPSFSASPTATLVLGSATHSPTASATLTASPSATRSASPTLSASPTRTHSATPSATVTASSTATGTATASRTVSASATATLVGSATHTPSASPSWTASSTASASPTVTVTPSISPTFSASPSFSASPTASPPGYWGPNPPVPGRAFVYPSPARNGRAWLALQMAQPGRAEIRIWNEAMSLVDRLDVDLPAGAQKAGLDVKAYATGVYFYQVRMRYSGGGSEQTSLLKFTVLR